MTTTNSEIRSNSRQQRRDLTKREQSLHAQYLAKQISSLNAFRYADKIAFYLTNDGEIDPSVIIKQAWNMGKHVYLPVLAPLKNQLYFSPYFPDTKMRVNRFGINEPNCSPKHWLKAQALNSLFLPLVAFDNSGNRIGMGGGFYDRTLAYLSHRTVSKKPRLIGLAHEIQRIKQISNNQWDVPLQTIITEKRIIYT